MTTRPIAGRQWPAGKNSLPPDNAPPDRKGGPLARRPATSESPGEAFDASSLQAGADVAAGMRRRREAAWRLPPLDCGHHDPLDCQRAAS
jgi:hypothetical protein